MPGPRRGRVINKKRSSPLGPFEMVVALVLISTLGKIWSSRQTHGETRGDLSDGGREELAAVRESMDDLSIRLGRLEEERDFYKDLLDSPTRPRAIQSPLDTESTSDTDVP